jgi:PAS domain S-box-containing protein
MATGSVGMPHIKGNIFQYASAILRWITEPSSIVEERQRRRVRLLSIFLLLLTINTLAGSMAMKNVGINLWIILLSVSAIFMVSYVISRTRYHQAATILAVIMPAVPPVTMTLFRSKQVDPAAELMWLALPLLVSSLLLPLRHTIFIAITYIIVIVLLGSFGFIGLESLTPALGFIFMIAFFMIAITAVRQRDQREIENQLTEREQAEEALANEATRRRILIEQSRDGIAVLDQNGKVYEANQRFAEMLGYSLEELRQLHVWDWDFVTPREQLIDILRSVDETGDHFETQHLRKDGTIYDVEISTNGAVFGGQKLVFCVCRDITERKQAEEALRESEEKFSKAFSASPDIISIVRIGDNKFIEVNDNFIRFIGYTREEIIGHSAIELGIWAKAEEREKILRMQKEQDRVSNEEAHICTKSGEIRTVLFSSEIIHIGGEPCSIAVVIDITEIKQADEALRESEEKFSKAFRSSPNTMVITTLKDGKFIEVNDSHTRITGYSREETIGHSTIELSLWTKAEDRTRMIKLLKEQGRVHNEEFDFRMKSGEIRTWLFSAEPINIGGEPCIISMTVDITEQKRADKALRESEEFSSSLTTSSAVPILVVNGDTSISYVNPAFEELTGFTSAESVGRKAPLPWWIKDKSSGNISELKRDVKTGIHGLEKLFQKKDGEQFWVEVTSAPVKRDGKFQYSLENWLNITERKQAEEALRESEEKFSKAFNASPEIISIVRVKDNRFIEVNDSFTRITGYTREETLNDRSVELNIWATTEDRNRILKKLRKQGRVYNEEVNFRIKSGKVRTVLFSAEIINIGGEPCAITMTADITERKAAEEKLKKALANLEHSSAQLAATNKELETFSYSVSHDLRSPLRSIDGFSQALLEDYLDKLDEQGQDYLNRLRAASQKMGELIDGMLKLSRLTRSDMHKEKIDLSTLAEEITTRLQETQPERQAEFIISRGLTASGDRQLLRALLENLLGNAWKFTSKRQPAKIEFGATQNGNKKAYFIRDNGAGFDMTYADKLFGAFQRLHEITEFPGTGIGLATVQRIIHRHGGSVWAEGAVEEGATFYFTLS